MRLPRRKLSIENLRHFSNEAPTFARRRKSLIDMTAWTARWTRYGQKWNLTKGVT